VVAFPVSEVAGVRAIARPQRGRLEALRPLQEALSMRCVALCTTKAQAMLIVPVQTVTIGD